MLSMAVGEATVPLSVLEQMVLVRLLEDRLQELCLEGLGADLHFSQGQEAIPVGVCAALRETDYVVTHHRSIAHAVAKGVPLLPLVAEVLGKANGMNGGLAGEMNMNCPLARFHVPSQLVGTCVSVAAGMAWTVKHCRKTDDIVVVFHGDAATANGQWHEGLNIAAVQNVPLLLICENNRLAGNVQPKDYLPVDYVRYRAIGYGIQSRYVNGNDLEAVLRVAKEAVAYVRSESRPLLLECATNRLGRHKQGQGDLRTAAELKHLFMSDPLKSVVIGDDRRAALSEQVEAAIAAALAGGDPSWPSTR